MWTIEEEDRAAIPKRYVRLEVHSEAFDVDPAIAVFSSVRTKAH